VAENLTRAQRTSFDRPLEDIVSELGEAANDDLTAPYAEAHFAGTIENRRSGS